MWIAQVQLSHEQWSTFRLPGDWPITINDDDVRSRCSSNHHHHHHYPLFSFRCRSDANLSLFSASCTWRRCSCPPCPIKQLTFLLKTCKHHYHSLPPLLCVTWGRRRPSHTIPLRPLDPWQLAKDRNRSQSAYRLTCDTNTILSFFFFPKKQESLRCNPRDVGSYK